MGRGHYHAVPAPSCTGQEGPISIRKRLPDCSPDLGIPSLGKCVESLSTIPLPAKKRNGATTATYDFPRLGLAGLGKDTRSSKSGGCMLNPYTAPSPGKIASGENTSEICTTINECLFVALICNSFPFI